VPVRGGVVTNDIALTVSLAERGLGLTYTLEPMVAKQLHDGRLRRVLEPYAATVPGFFLYFPSRAHRSAPLRLFVEAARELSMRENTPKGGA
jgi:DNA-binding transcriptional LysR family regulator